MSEDESVPTWHRALQMLFNGYGPYAFSLVSLLVLWVFIVEPQLELQAIDFKAQEAAIDALQQLNSSQATTADVLNRTAASLEVVSATLERTAEKLSEALRNNHD